MACADIGVQQMAVETAINDKKENLFIVLFLTEYTLIGGVLQI
jgi:hypothetical protein